MKSSEGKNILISGASIAGLSTAYWMNKLGYRVTVVEIASEPRTAGAAIDIRDDTVEIARRMGIYEELKQHRLNVEKIEFKNEIDVTEGSVKLAEAGEEITGDDIEIERDKFLGILFGRLKDNVTFMFNDSITALDETSGEIKAVFKSGTEGAYDLVIGCDGIHSAVRRISFGHEKEYIHFLKAYFSITIVNKLLIRENTMQMFNVPDKAFTLNAYNNKTDVIFSFYSEEEIPYHYRDAETQKQIIRDQFTGQGWRTNELLEAALHTERFYFDKFCQVKMPSWTKGRIALVGDAGYCASPAAGMGASLSMAGASALADAIQKHDGDFALAFQEYNTNLRPFINAVQKEAAQNVIEKFIPRTEAAIRKRNLEGF